MNNYTVYMHISPSGKRYIGITSQKVERRWQNGYGYKSNEYFTRAINKYGWENFKHIIIATDLSEEQAKEMEVELIAKYDSTNTEKGYNITKGGEGTNGWTPSEETRKKMSESHADFNGENHPMYGKCHTDASKKKMSEVRIEKDLSKGENNPMYGKNPLDYMTEEAKKKRVKKISKANSGINNPRIKSVIAIINDKIFGVFDYIKQGAEHFNCNYSSIVNCCKGKYKSSGKYNGYKIVWRYITIIEL